MDIQFNFGIKNGNFAGNFAGNIRGAITTIIGPSGSGKTTFLKCFSGDLKPTYGYIKIGSNILFSSDKKIEIPQHKRNISMVYQNDLLFPHMSVKKNILYGYKYNKESSKLDILRICKILKIDKLMNKKPSELSGGESQRVALARSICSNPYILLLDEPFNSLDVVTKAPILFYLKELQKILHLQILFVTHSYQEMFFLSGNSILIDEGEIKLIGDPHEVISKKIKNLPTNEINNYLSGVVIEKIQKEDNSGVVSIGEIKLVVPINDCSLGSKVIVQFFASDVIISTEELTNVSARNIIKGEVLFLEEMENSYLLTILISLDIKIYVEITRYSMEKLCINKGSTIFALLKSSSCRVLGY